MKRWFSRAMWKRSGSAVWRLVLFAVALLYAVTLTGCAAEGTTRILSYYGDMSGVKPGLRPTRHTGVDFDGAKGDPVIAAADGTVVDVLPESARPCGNGLIIEHRVDDTPVGWTIYCHMDETNVQRSQRIKRGDVVGKLGATGQSLGVPHLHFGLCPDQPCRGFATATVDPLPFIVGCFDPAKTETYAGLEANRAKPRLVLTYPVRCARRK